MEKENILEQITLINNDLSVNKEISYEEKEKVLLMIRKDSEVKEKNCFTHITNLKVRHHCYDALQLSYRIISKEAAVALTNPTDENLVIILGQYGVTQVLEQYLKKEQEIPLEVLIEMSNRTIHTIDKSSKVFKKINNISE